MRWGNRLLIMAALLAGLLFAAADVAAPLRASFAS